MEKKNKVGETNIAKNGQKMMIVEYFNSQNITVEFSDGTIIKNKNYDAFKKGSIKNPNYKKDDTNIKIGETNIAKNGQKMIIIAYRGCNDTDIKFEDGTVVCNKRYEDFKKGHIEK